MLHPDGVRFAGHPEMLFDMIDGARIDCLPGAHWSGRMPPVFFATIAALTLAWRGALPMHASAVAIDGHGVLLCGASGAGKSTLAASLLAQGARFVGDDLSALWPGADDAPAAIAPGRLTMRLHADTAGWIDATTRVLDDGDGRGKWRVEPVQRAAAAVPLAMVAMLGGVGRVNADDLGQHMFRPRWMAALPGQDRRLEMVAQIAATVPVIALPAVAIAGRSDFDRLGRTAMAAIRAALGC